MKWRKLGRLFTPPTEWKWAATHGQVPFAQPLAGTVIRVFFTPKDRSHRSHVAVMTLDLKRLDSVRIQAAPALSPGRRGAFDDDGAMMGSLIEADDGVRAYYQGWNPGGNVAFRCAVGVAWVYDKQDCVTFERRFEGAVFDRSPTDPFFLGTPFVIRDGDEWRMWYMSGTGWDEDGEPRYGIRHARSPNGIEWRPDIELCLPPEADGDQMLTRPSVLKDGNLFRMWYSVRRKNAPYRIGYAESEDGVTWTRCDHRSGLVVSDQGWDSEMVCYPHVFDAAGERYMLYSGNSFGRFGFGLALFENY